MRKEIKKSNLELYDDISTKTMNIEISEYDAIEIEKKLALVFTFNKNKKLYLKIPSFLNYFNFVRDSQKLVILVFNQFKETEILDYTEMFNSINNEDFKKLLKKLIINYEKMFLNKKIRKLFLKIMKRYFNFGNIFNRKYVTFRQFKKQVDPYQLIYIFSFVVNMKEYLKKNLKSLTKLFDLDAQQNTQQVKDTSSLQGFGQNMDLEMKKHFEKQAI